jgi:hypothetical protein
LAHDDAAMRRRANPRLRKSLGYIFLIGAVVLIGAGVALYRARVPHGISLTQLQWASSSQGARKAVHGRIDAARTGLWWDLWALILFSLGLLLACYLGLRVNWTRGWQRWTAAGMTAAFAAGVFGAVQDWLLLITLDDRLRGSWIFRFAEALSLARYSALLVAGAIGVMALATTLGRLFSHKRTYRMWTAALRGQARPVVIPPPLIEVEGGKTRPASADDRFCQCWRDGGQEEVGSCCERERQDQARSPESSGSTRHPARNLAGRIARRVVGPPALLDADLCRCWWDTRLAGPQTHWTQGFASPVGLDPRRTGICVSGGGIRSAAVALGALQAMRDEKVVNEEAYLVSVSGGGYTTGAMQLALPLDGPGAPVAAGQTREDPAATTAANVFARGSAEEDHMRRHSSYVADGLAQWIVAMAVLFRGVVCALVVGGLTITVLGLAIGKFYTYVGIVDHGNLAALKPLFLLSRPSHARPPHAPGFPVIAPGVTLAVVTAAALTVIMYFFQLWSIAWSPREHRISQIARALLAVTAVLATVGVALPAVIWASSRVTWTLGFNPAKAISAGTLSVVVAYGGTVAATLWRKRATLVKSADTASGWFRGGTVRAVLPNSMMQMVIMWICLAVVSLAALLFGGWVATSGADQSWWALAPVAALALVAAFVDQTSLSLHPFYRLRLARAFAVRRVAQAGGAVAVPYGDDEMTWLSTYASPRPGFPEVTFMATANITGQGRTPPGRPAVPFTLRYDYIGSQEAGWVRTAFLQEIAKPRINGDLTVEAAMAISGAAFASAMGSQTRFYELFLALSNARLGAWLPNPYFVALKLQHLDDWTIPGLPRTRRLSYLAREIFGIHPSTGRLLFCTDGGHYDNLGLVELLRRRCKRIYCIDASGALPPLDDTLAASITLAREELGVEITFKDDAYKLIAGSAEAIKPAATFADLNMRLSKSAVTVATITYPPAGSHPKEHGDLVLAQAVLTREMPYQLLEFSQNDVGFPRDSTADQSFNSRQFDAYQQLGQFIGRAAAQREAPGPARPKPPAHDPRHTRTVGPADRNQRSRARTLAAEPTTPAKQA